MATKALCLLLCFVCADAATLSATKLSLSDPSRVVEKEAAPLQSTIQEPAKPSLAETAVAVDDKSDSWEDEELDQPGLPSAKPRTPADTAIVKAKVKQVMKLIESHKTEFNDPKTSEQRKDSMLMETLALSTQHTGTKGYNFEECLELWQQVDQESARVAFYKCPQLYFPEAEAFALDIDEVKASKPSALKSAYLSGMFWNAMLKNDLDKVESLLSANVTMYEENRAVATGKEQVAMKAPYIGWPRAADTAAPEEWTCDASGCIVPIKGWSSKTCPVMAKFNAGGEVSFVTANLFCWR